MKYTADFECTVPNNENFETFTKTHVWLACIMEVGGDDPAFFLTVKDFLDYCSKLSDRNPEIYFHNLNYDGWFIIDYLMKSSKYKQRTKRGKLGSKEFRTMISNDSFYSFKICYKKKTITFKDSLKLLPFSVDTIAKSFKTKAQKLKGTVDYTKERDEDYQPTEQEFKYIENDVRVMAEALQHLEDRGMLKNLTIGSACMNEYKSILKSQNEDFDLLFPVFSTETYNDLAGCYKGGWCFCKEESADLRGVNGNTYDVSSLYPWSQHSLTDQQVKEYQKLWPEVRYIQHVYPFEYPIKVTNIDEIINYMGQDYLFIINFNCNLDIKKNHLPFLQSNSGFGLESKFIEHVENLNLTLTCVAWELMFEQYDVSDVDINYCYFFSGATGLFDKYIDKWYNEKSEAGKRGDKVSRQIAKLYLNNLGGKFGTKTIGDQSVLSFNDDKIEVKKEPISKDSVYLPAAAFMTDYGRCLTIRTAQANFDRFYYADTDSIHIVGKAENCIIGHNLGEWENESSWTDARFIRQKTYLEYTTKTDEKDCEPFFNIKACGCPDTVKERMLYHVELFEDLDRDEDDNILNEKRSKDEILDRFNFGLEESGKLMSKLISGGKILYQSSFCIKKYGSDT